MYCFINDCCFDSVDSPITDCYTVCPDDCTKCCYYPPNVDSNAENAFFDVDEGIL